MISRNPRHDQPMPPLRGAGCITVSFRPAIPRRPGRTSLTRGNVGGSHTPGKRNAETALAGCMSAQACPMGKGGSLAYYNWFAFEFWRFVFVQQEVGKAAQSFIEFPPMQKGASFNMAAVKAQIEEAIAAHTAK